MVHGFLGLASRENTLKLFRHLYDESLSPPKSNLKLAFYLDLKKEKKTSGFSVTFTVWGIYVNLLTSMSDQHSISPYIITPESYIQVTRIKKMIINQRSSWLLNKFSFSAPKEMYREQ